MWQIIKKAISIMYEISIYDKDSGKPIWKSKTLWVNIIALAGMLSSNYLGIELSKDEQGAILVIVNIFMRLISKDKVGLIAK